MTTRHFWILYTTFNDPPGPERGLKCIQCRYATAGASSVVGLIGAYGVSKTMMANVYTGMACAFVSLLGFGSAAVALKSASLDKQWNEIRIRETMETISKERREFREQNQVASQ